jgi:hypothetical protein
VAGFWLWVTGGEKHAFFGRLEIEILLKLLGLRRFLIGRLAIRNGVSGLTFLARSFAIRFAAATPGTDCAKQNTNRSLPYVNLICKEFSRDFMRLVPRLNSSDEAKKMAKISQFRAVCAP